MTKKNLLKNPFFIATVALVVPFVLLWWFPVMTDEAYYLAWVKRSAWPRFGFFDHPPFVSWQGVLARFTTRIAPARLGVWISSLISFLFTWKTANKILGSPTKAWTASIFVASSFAGIANGILLTPDSGLGMWWTIAIHEAVVALQGKDRRWLTAGIATGMGLMAKYTMVLIGPVFLWGLIHDNRDQLKKIWPYLGGCAALLIFLPHLYWNSQHDWITLRFQFGHGFSVKRELTIGSTLPKAHESLIGSPEIELYNDLQRAMSTVSGFAETKKVPKPQKSKLELAWQRTGDYIGGVLGLWGVYASVIIGLAWQRYRNRSLNQKTTHRSGWALIQAATVWPLLFFGIVCPFTKIEANGPAMHMMTGAVILAGLWVGRWRWIWVALGIHSLVALVICLLATAPDLIPNGRSNRLVVETSGYEQLTDFIGSRATNEPIAVDTYQLRAALAYYQPNLHTVQWPGITRPSEFTRGDLDDVLLEQDILKQHSMTLVTFEDFPPSIPGYIAKQLEGIRACPDGSIGSFNVSHPVLPCEKGLREWWIVTYDKLPTAH